MNAAALKLALFVIQEAVKYLPSLSAKLRELFSKGEPTAADWEKLHAEVEGLDYFKFVPNSDLPRES